MSLLQQSYLVLVRPEGPINVGLCCRAAANMGIRAVRLVAPGPRALTPEQARPFACRATDLLDSVAIYDTLPAALADTDFALATSRRIRRGRQTFLSERSAAERVAACPRAAAIVFGSEADGLTTEELQACTATLALDLPGSYPSLNLSHAVAVVLWSLCAQGPRSLLPNRTGRATGAHRRALLQLWQKTLEETGYFLHAERGRFAAKLQALTDNLTVSQRDAQLLAGMLQHFRRLGPKPVAPADAAPMP